MNKPKAKICANCIHAGHQFKVGNMTHLHCEHEILEVRAPIPPRDSHWATLREFSNSCTKFEQKQEKEKPKKEADPNQMTIFDQEAQFKKPHFDGPEYEPELDHERLTGQMERVFNCMRDSVWRTLDEISHITKDPHASISAQLRHLRKPRFGSHTIEKRRRGEPKNGLYEYKLTVNDAE